MKTLESRLITARENILEKLKELFINKAVEAHIFGSVARNDADAYSDIDIWFTFNDTDYDEIYNNRFEYYSHLGETLHICEAPQNAPIGGVHTVILIKSNDVISVVDIYLCPLSNAYVTDDGRKLFGLDLPKGKIEFNPQKIQVNENYRIDFFICFIFGTIKKLARHVINPLDGVFREYEHLYKDYKIPVNPLRSPEQNLNTLERMIENIYKVSNQKQNEVLTTIHNFAKIVLE